MNRLHRSLAALAAALLLAPWAQAQDDALYRAWGEKAGIQAVMQDFVTRLKTDPQMAPFFKDVSHDYLAGQLTAQLCQLAGGPCVYDGETMKAAHASQEIRPRDFNRLVELLQESMAARGLPFAVQNAMLARLAPMHRDIVNRD